jgi:hypothetical protein
MDAKHRGIQILGWLSALAGYSLALLLIRGIYLGVTRGFGTAPLQAFSVALGYLIFFGLAVYLVMVGRRSLSIAQGNSLLKARFGWGRIVLGAVFLYGNIADRFHLLPVNSASHFRHLEPANTTQATSMKVTAIVIVLGCVLLIFSGIWRGFRIRRVLPTEGQ